MLLASAILAVIQIERCYIHSYFVERTYCTALHRRDSEGSMPRWCKTQVLRQPYQMRQAFGRAGLETVCRSRFGRLEAVTRNSRSVS